jgi:hypothetical protein
MMPAAHRVVAFALVLLALAGSTRAVHAQAAAPAAPAPAPAAAPAAAPSSSAMSPGQTPATPPAVPAPPPADEKLCELDDTGSEAGSWIGAGFAVGLLNMPKLGIGLELLGEVRTPVMWPIEIGAVYWLENDDELNSMQTDLIAHPVLAVPYPPGGSRLQIQEMMLSAALCPYEFEMNTGSFLACAGAAAGLLRATGEGFVNESAVTRALFELDAYARWHFRLGSGVGITYSAGVFVPFLRDHFGYHDRFGAYHDQFRIAAIGGRLDLAITYGF